MFDEHTVDVGRLLRGRERAGRPVRGDRAASRDAAEAARPVADAARGGQQPPLDPDDPDRADPRVRAGTGPGRPVAAGRAGAAARARRRRARRSGRASRATTASSRSGCGCIGRTEAALPGSVTVDAGRAAGSRRATITRSPDADGGECRGALFAGEVRVPGVTRWWPHTHGAAALTTSGWRPRIARTAPPRSTSAGSASGRSRPVPGRTTTSSATACSSTSTASRSSPAARSGRRSMPSTSARPGPSSGPPSRRSGRPG